MPWPCLMSSVRLLAPVHSFSPSTISTHRLCYIIDHHCAVCVSVVHGRQRFVSLLARGIPDLELYCGLLIEGNRLREEGGADGGFSVVVELVLW